MGCCCYDNKHLEKKNISYVSHFKKSSKLSCLFFGGSLGSMIHACFPCFFTEAASQTNKNASEILES